MLMHRADRPTRSTAAPDKGSSLSILVTGANGFVGRHLCADLHRQGYQVRPAVRDFTRVADLPGRSISVGALSAETDWSSAVTGVDVVVHLAATGVYVMNESAAHSPAAFRSVNVTATEALAKTAARHGVKRLIYVSSIKVNGEMTGDTPLRPDDAPQPQDRYGVSKWEAEQALWRVAEESGLEVTVLRPPLIYGPRVYGNFLRLMKLVERGLPVPLGAVENRRSMIYNGNLASALTACATRTGAAGRTYLVSDDEDLSTPHLIAQLAGLMGKSARLWRVPPKLLKAAGALTGKAAEVDRLIGSLRVDSSRIRDELDWSPPFTVIQGLAETARWFCGARMAE